tara:strand:- start:320 stop:733 length:414 start_codon:yes stop_codon:yes gene_type:complete
MSVLKKVYFFIVFVAAAWSLVVVGVSLFSEEKLLFMPLPQMTNDTHAADRLEVLRLSWFLLFAYFALFHVFGNKIRFTSGHVLVSIMTGITLVGASKLLMSERFPNDAFYVIAFGLFGMVIILGSRPSVRRYFRRRG